jgi:hypothetical protein
MRMSDPNYQDVQTDSSKVLVGCGCRSIRDVVTFIRERRIECVELAWADEMGLWHNEIVPVSELTYASLQEGIPCKDGRFLLIDPLSARIAPLTQPNTMLFTCKPPNRSSSLKTKQLSPGWIEMISKKLMENDKRPLDRLLTNDLLDEVNCSPRVGITSSAPIGVPGSPNYAVPASPGISSTPCSPTGSPLGSPGTLHNEASVNSGFIEWKLVRNEGFASPPSGLFPHSPTISDGNPSTPPSSVPGSPSLPSPRSPIPPDSGQEEREEIPETKGKYFPHVPPLLRPRQIHPTKANKLGITKPTKKRRNTEHLYCRHCGTTETPEWRRGPDGRKSLCNACGLYFSKMIKRETMVVPQCRRVAIDALLNPNHS